MKAFIFKCILPFCLAGLLISCNTEARKVWDNNIQFDSLFVDKTYHLLDVDTNPGCSLQIRFIYPVNYTDKDIASLVQQQFIAGFFGEEYVNLTPEEAAERYVNTFIQTYKEDEKNFQLERENHGDEISESWFSIEESLSNQIVYNQNDLLSFVVHSESYYGNAAHGAHRHINRVVNLKDGQQIREDEIFIEDYQDDLAKIIVDAIALSKNVEIAELENIGFFNVGEIVPNKNFYADEIGITYTFNEYEIAAYVVGNITVQIPYDKIRHLMRSTSPLSGIAF